MRRAPPDAEPVALQAAPLAILFRAQKALLLGGGAQLSLFVGRVWAGRYDLVHLAFLAFGQQ